MDLGDLFNLTIVNRFNYASFHPFNEAKDPYQQHQAGLADSPIGIHQRHYCHAHRALVRLGEVSSISIYLSLCPNIGLSSGTAVGRDNI